METGKSLQLTQKGRKWLLKEKQRVLNASHDHNPKRRNAHAIGQQRRSGGLQRERMQASAMEKRKGKPSATAQMGNVPQHREAAAALRSRWLLLYSHAMTGVSRCRMIGTNGRRAEGWFPSTDGSSHLAFESAYCAVTCLMPWRVVCGKGILCHVSRRPS